MEKKDKKEKINFEENIKELEQIVHDLESGNVALDEALEKFNKAYQLSKECDTKLKEVSESVNKILTEDGKLEEFTIPE
ncbi:MAG: exodeoxyribonuclease VII small subunit [Bacilli bacterium]|nr:exodeoxyribonuclease VII small subunit [Bacilli bacterium]